MAAKVIVSTYEELPPRRRSISHGGASAAATRALRTSSTPRQAAGGGYNRRALLLAYARQLRRRRVALQQRGPPLLEWGRWKTGTAVVGSGGDVTTGRRTTCYSRVRSCVRLWIRRIRENASCKTGY